VRPFLRRSRGAAALVACVAAAVAPLVATPLPGAAQVNGASPANGSIGPANGSSTSWDFDPILGAGVGGTPIEVVCAPVQCSKFDLKINLPKPDSDFYQHYIAVLTFRCSWTSPVGDSSVSAGDDVDCFAFSPNGAESGPGDPDTGNLGPNFEEINVTDPQSGVWSMRADAGAPVPVPTVVHGVARLTFVPAVHPAVQSRLATDQQFANYDFPTSYQSKDALGRPNAGEPSIGVDWATGAVMYMAGSQVTRLTYDNSRPPKPTPTDVTPVNSLVNEDAILFTDRETHRTWALGLLLAGSHLAYSDDDGANWTPSVAFSPPALPDHETLGSGPYHKPLPSGAGAYPHAVYYCAQTIVQDAYCGRSDDGGMTFAIPATPLWNGVCSAIHGHVRVGPTGIVYVPNGSCTDAKGASRSGVAVSVDNGQSFTVSVIPDSSSGSSDPSVMEGPDGTVYFGYQGSDGHPMVATATHNPDGSLKWHASVDVGRFQNPGEAEDNLSLGVQNTEFAEVITGDAGRAAYAFLGTGRPGNDQAGDYAGTWYLYVSYTFDGGRTWRTVNATPHNPVQRGCVWNGGLVNACRNMLDFNDIGIDKQGRVYVAYTDGCTTTDQYSCDTTPGIHGWNNGYSGDVTGCTPSELDTTFTSTSTCSFARVSAVARQICGRGLVAAYDPGASDSPSCASTASSGGGTVSGGGSSSGGGGGGTQGVSSLPNTAAVAASQWPAGLVILALLGGGIGVGRARRRREFTEK
jgi:hypothetical protein